MNEEKKLTPQVIADKTTHTEWQAKNELNATNNLIKSISVIRKKSRAQDFLLIQCMHIYSLVLTAKHSIFKSAKILRKIIKSELPGICTSTHRVTNKDLLNSMLWIDLN